MSKHKRTIKTPPKARPERREEIAAAVAKSPPERASAEALRKKFRQKRNLRQRIKNFFFPSHFGAEVGRGIQIGSPYGCTTVLFGLLYRLGKFIRMVIDPQHKMFMKRNKKEGK